MENDASTFDDERKRLDNKYKELTESRVKNFVKEAGRTDAASDVKDIFVSDVEKFKSEAHIAKMSRLKEYQEQLLLGDRTRFGDGDGSWWDRWLTQRPPQVSSLRTGTTLPKCGFKRHHPKQFQIETQTHNSETNKMKEIDDENTSETNEEENNYSGTQDEKEEEKQLASIQIEPMEGTERLSKTQKTFNTDTAKTKAERFEAMAKMSTARLLARLRCESSDGVRR